MRFLLTKCLNMQRDNSIRRFWGREFRNSMYSLSFFFTPYLIAWEIRWKRFVSSLYFFLIAVS